MNTFPVYVDAKVLSSATANEVVEYAKRRLRESCPHELNVYTSRIKSIRHEDIDLDLQVGFGSFSSVFNIKKIKRGSFQKYPDRLVVKVLRPKLTQKPKLLGNSGADLYKEALIIASMTHKNIINIHAWEPSGVNAYANGRHDGFFILLDRLDETLVDRMASWTEEYLKIKKCLTYRDLRKYELLQKQVDSILPIAAALNYMHRKRLIHRDLKPENVGFHKSSGQLKVFDFDVSRIVPDEYSEGETFKMTRTGSPRYMAPEVALGKPYNLSADVYSLTVLIHEILTLKKPFAELNPERSEFFKKICKQGIRPELPTSWPTSVKECLERGWHQDLTKRPAMAELETQLHLELAKLLSDRLNRSQRMGSRFNLRGSRLPVSLLAASVASY